MKHIIHNGSLLNSPNLTAETYPVCRQYKFMPDEWNQTFTHSRYPCFMFAMAWYPKQQVCHVTILDPDCDEENDVSVRVFGITPQSAMVRAVMAMECSR